MCRLDDWDTVVWFRAGARDFCWLSKGSNWLWAQPVSPLSQMLGQGAGHTPPSSPPHAFMAPRGTTFTLQASSLSTMRDTVLLSSGHKLLFYQSINQPLLQQQGVWCQTIFSAPKPTKLSTQRYNNNEIISNVNLMQQGDFINVFLARHVLGTYTHHQEH